MFKIFWLNFSNDQKEVSFLLISFFFTPGQEQMIFSQKVFASRTAHCGKAFDLRPGFEEELFG